MKPATLLNLIAILFLGAGALLTLFPSIMAPAELQGALWGGLIAWLASARVNGQNSTSP